MLAFLSGYIMYNFSNIMVFISLATLLHLQFGRTGIVNFGVVGFFGLGMYGIGVFHVTLGLPYLVALLLATIVAGVVAFGLGKIILDLDSQSVLVATLAFATVVADLVTTEKGITRGVRGLGTVPFPIQIGRLSQFLFFIVAGVIAALLILYALKSERSPHGRLMMAIRDNEPLAKGLGKATSRDKLIFFSITSALMAFLGTMYASNIHFLVPRLLGPSTTFAVWIALILGGRKRVLGGLIGTLATLGLFDFLIETYVPIPPAQAQVLPVIKMMIYGLTLVLVLMYRPTGILGVRKAAGPGIQE